MIVAAIIIIIGVLSVVFTIALYKAAARGDLYLNEWDDEDDS